jgi:hypothetical protein
MFVCIPPFYPGCGNIFKHIHTILLILLFTHTINQGDEINPFFAELSVLIARFCQFCIAAVGEM